jgi:RsiW-degrading membrane proteinase PrsW (M82 family)
MAALKSRHPYFFAFVTLSGLQFIRIYGIILFMNLLIPQVIAFLFPLVFLVGLRQFNYYKTGRFSYNLLTIAWGAIAYGLAYWINSTIIDKEYVTEAQLVYFAAPIIEETLKSLILYFLIRRADFYFIVDGIIYGFGAGIGFAVFENIEYIQGHPEIAMSLALSRVFSTNLIHATGSAVIGTALAGSRFDRSVRGWGILLFGILFSISAHMGFNYMVNQGVFLFVAILVGLSGAGFISFVTKISLSNQKKTMKKDLDAIQVESSITKKDALLVDNLDVIKNKLADFKQKFGSDKAKTAEAYLLKQAHLVMAEQNLTKIHDETLRTEVEQNISELENEIKNLQAMLGWDASLAVRVIIRENPELFKSATKAVDEEAERNKGRAGTGSWNKVGVEKTRSSNDGEAQ